MSKIDIARAWKDESYRLSLSDAERASLPANPAGPVELSDADLTGAGGDASPLAATITTTMCGSFCTCPTKSLACSLCDFCG